MWKKNAFVAFSPQGNISFPICDLISKRCEDRCEFSRPGFRLPLLVISYIPVGDFRNFANIDIGQSGISNINFSSIEKASLNILLLGKSFWYTFFLFILKYMNEYE